MVRRGWRGGARRWAGGMALALAAWWAWGARAPTELSTSAAFPGAAPHAVAHLLADWSTHADAPRPWRVERERTNYTSWQYVVRYDCEEDGRSCAGSARVEAHELGPSAPRHGLGHAAEHRVLVARTDCARLPLLPWAGFCDEFEWAVAVVARGGGALVEVQARAWCGLLGGAPARCARLLAERTRLHLAAVRAAVRAALPSLDPN